jgi:hypothetical protein
MDSEQQQNDDVLERLIRELGLSEGASSSSDEGIRINFLESAPASLDERETRIVETTLQWLGFLDRQEKRVRTAASLLFERLLGWATLSTVNLEPLRADRDAAIDRLEWTLASLGYWIEEQQPDEVEGARFHVRWTDDDGVGQWRTTGDRSTPETSLRAVVRDGAEVEGEFMPPVSTAIAMLVVEGLRTGTLAPPPRLRVIDGASTSEESVYELMSRTEARTAEIARADDTAPIVPPEVEARLGSRGRMAELIDDASYAAAEATPDASLPFFPPSLEVDVAAGIRQVAASCDMDEGQLVRCLLLVANQRLASSVKAGNFEAALRLGRNVTHLAAFAIREPEK